MINPTGKDIRNDSGGLGYFGAPRGYINGKPRFHEGLDFSTTIGQTIVSPITGRVMNFPGASNPHYPMLEIHPTKIHPEFDFLQILYVDKPEVIQENIFRNIKAGEAIGKAVDLKRWYSSSVGPYVHLQMFKDKNKIDPTPFFFKK